MRRAILGAATYDGPEAQLFVAIIEQAVFDAHLQSTAGVASATKVVKDARGYFTTDGFQFICELLGVDPDWVRNMTSAIGSVARDRRGDEYDLAIVPRIRRRRRAVHSRRDKGNFFNE